MEIASIPANEKERLRALNEYSILDTLPEKEFDDITRLASEICETPISTITLIDLTRQWFKSKRGMSSTETSRDVAFCSHTINNPDEMMVVPDARKDVRFHDNPLVTGPEKVIFYAGVPLTNEDGFTLGSLCIIDSRPRELTQRQTDSLKALANQVTKLFELRKKNIQLEDTRYELIRRNEELNQFAYVVSHDIKSPLKNIISLLDILKMSYDKVLDNSGMELIGHLNKSAVSLRNFIDGILAYYKGDTVLAEQREKIVINEFFKGIVNLVDAKKEFAVSYPQENTRISVNKVALEQIFINLLTNSIKYNDKEKGVISITFTELKEFYLFSVKDNGSGIDKKDLNKIFEVFANLGKRDRYNNLGSGIGLSTVKKLIERLGGKLTVNSEVGVGTEFEFTLSK